MSAPKKRNSHVLLASLLVYVACLAAFAAWSNRQTELDLYENIDKKLFIAASGLRFMLAPDFHDRAVDADSVTMAEEMDNRVNFNEYSAETGFKWIYTLVEKDGRFFFAAPTVSEEEARDRERWYFYPYDDVPPEFVDAFRNGTTVYLDYSDQWGKFRSIAKAETSPGGRKYLACVDYETGYIQSLLLRNLTRTISIALVFLLFSLPFVLAVRYLNRSFNRELEDHRDRLEIEVEERTAELRKAKEKSDAAAKELAKALEEVKTLRGFLPICAKCKKIRDDHGYWQQIESYIQERSEAEFTHSICPDCLKELHPDLANRVMDRLTNRAKNHEK